MFSSNSFKRMNSSIIRDKRDLKKSLVQPPAQSKIMASGQVAQGFIQLSLEDICRHRLQNLLEQLLNA